MAKGKKKRKQDDKTRIPKATYQTPISRVRPVKITGPRYYLQNAREYPIFGCWIYKDWQKSGITPVVVARRQSEDKVIFGVCMVDIWCLGIKDAYANADFSRRQFEQNLSKMCNYEPEECSVEFAHELIYGAMEYAKRYGFTPHVDFTRQFVDRVLDPPDAHPREGNIEFGKDGQPFYASGPYDDESKINQVLRTLKRTAGDENFKFMIALSTPDSFFEP